MTNDGSSSATEMNMMLPSVTQALPLFSEHGTTLNSKQQLERAKKKGLCVRCGIKTHTIMPFRAHGITNDDVHMGHCIKCEPDEVPIRVLKEWDRANPHQLALAKKTQLYPNRGSNYRQRSTSTSERKNDRNASNRHNLRASVNSAFSNSGKDREVKVPPQTNSNKRRVPITLAVDPANDFGRLVSELEVSEVEDPTMEDYSSMSISSQSNGCKHTRSKGSTASVCTYGTVGTSASRMRDLSSNNETYGDDNDGAASTTSYGSVSEKSMSVWEEMSPKATSKSAVSSWLRDLSIKIGVDDEDDQSDMVYREKSAQSGAISALIQCVNNHPDIPTIQRYGCVCIRGYAAAKPDGKRYMSLLVQKGALDTLFTAMDQHPDNTKLLIECLAALQGLCAHKCATSTIAQRPPQIIPNAVTKAMKQHGSDAALIQQACQFLQTIAAAEETLRARMASSQDCISTLTTAMNTHARLEGVQREVTAVLHEISRPGNGSGRQYLKDALLLQEEGAVKSVMAAMEQYNNKGARDLASHGSGFLKNLCHVDETRTSIALAGGIVLLIAAMRTHPDDPILQCRTCAALKHLCFEEANEVIIGNQGGITSVVEAIKHHQQDLNVLQEACAALRNLSVTDRNRGAIAEHEEDMTVLISVMKDNISHDMFQQKACGALRNLSSHPQFRKSICQIGGVSTTISVMEQHTEDDRIQTLACGILRNLSVDKNNEAVLEFGERGMGAILASLQRHPASRKLACQACGALRNATKHKGNRETIVRLDGMSTIITTMSQHPSEATVQKESIEFLLNMSIDKGNSASIGNHGGITAILEAMKTHSRDSNLQSSGCGALWNLSASLSVQPMVLEERADLAVVSAMKRHEKSVTVQKKGCLALSTLATIDKCKSYLCENGTTEVVIAAIVRHEKDAQVLKYAFKYLAAMADSSKSAIAQQEPALRRAMKQHEDNPDLLKYSNKVLPL